MQTRIRGDRADNLEKAIAALEAALTVYTREDLPRDWATDEDQSRPPPIRTRIRGDRADRPGEMRSAPTRRRSRSSRARSCRASGLRRRTTSANAYRTRIRGDRADNLEKADCRLRGGAHGSDARGPAAGVGATQNNLAQPPTADRIRGDRADNLEKAIAAYEAALTVSTREALPRDWALRKTISPTAYRRPCPRRRSRQPGEGHRRLRGGAHGVDPRGPAARLGGDAEQPRLRLSEPHPRRPGRQPGEGDCRLRGGAHSPYAGGHAARVGVDAEQPGASPTRTASAAIGPTTWRRPLAPTRRRSRSGHARPCRAIGPTTQNNLAIAYRDRIRGDRADNLEKAIAAYEAALTVSTREALPPDWARRRTTSASPTHRIRGDRADNLEKAIAAYEAALTVRRARPCRASGRRRRTTSPSPIRDRIRGDRADNLEKAIGAYEAALTVITREACRGSGRDAEQSRPRLSTASAAIGPTTWRRLLPPTRRRSRSSHARPCRASGRRRRQPRQRYGPHPRRSGRQPGEGDWRL